jgi:mannose-6-phosphate isomerase-like protein (cupin superfamily)
MAIDKVSLAAAFAAIPDPWNPRIAGDINDFQIKLVRLRGAFEWHSHLVEDELFLVVEGRMRMRFRSHEVELSPGEFIIVPHGVEHLPEAIGEDCCVVLLEPSTTLNTGGVVSERTVHAPTRLAGN